MCDLKRRLFRDVRQLDEDTTRLDVSRSISYWMWRIVWVLPTPSRRTAPFSEDSQSERPVAAGASILHRIRVSQRRGVRLFSVWMLKSRCSSLRAKP